MTDKKYTDEDIISSLEIIATTRNCNECKIRNCKWGTCNCEQIAANAALDLINRQQAEYENLKVENQSLRSAANSLKMHYEEAQAEVEGLKPFEDKIAKFKSHIRVEDMLVFASSLEEWLEFCDNLKSEAIKEFCEKRGIKYVEDDV